MSDYGGASLNRLLSIPKKNTLIHIGAYCLMKNHFHLLLHEINGNGISIFMQKLATAYTMYFNKRYERSGVLFQGKFKSIHVQSDRQLKYLFSYIHLNPVETLQPTWRENGIKDLKKTKEFLNSYPYSSHLDYIDNPRIESVILDRKSFPRYFASRHDVDKEISSWLTFPLTVKVRP